MADLPSAEEASSFPTVHFEKEFDNQKECEVWLIRKRFYGMPLNKKIVLDDCYKKK